MCLLRPHTSLEGQGDQQGKRRAPQAGEHVPAPSWTQPFRQLRGSRTGVVGLWRRVSVAFPGDGLGRR